MAFEALEVAVELAESLGEPLRRLEQHDRELAAQARRATTSVALCLGEGQRRQGKDRLHLFRVAAGSAAEVRTALRVAVAWGYVSTDSVSRPTALLDRVAAMLWRLAPPRVP